MAVIATQARKQFNPAMFSLAREARGLSQIEVAKQAGIPQAMASRLEAGKAVPASAVVERIARVTGFPEDFFSQNEAVFPFGSSSFYHRKQESVTSPVLRRVQGWVNIYRIHLLKLLKATDFDSRCRFTRFDISGRGTNLRDLAGLLRATWRLPPGPIYDLVNAIEGAGGVVIRFDFGTPKMFGISEWVPPAPPLFFLNENPQISGERDRFTLAHEIAHIVLHSMPNPAMEKQADDFAGEFLMPEREIRAHLRTPLKLEKLLELKKYWKVSMQAVLEQAYRLGVVNERQRQYLWSQIAARGFRLREPIEIPKEQPTLLKGLVRAHVWELGYSVDELASMLCLTREEFLSVYPYEEPRIRLVK